MKKWLTIFVLGFNTVALSAKIDPEKMGPNPEVFLEVLIERASVGPCDKVTIYELSLPPSHFDASNLPSDGSITYYRAELLITGFQAEERIYECYIRRDQRGAVVSSGWITTPPIVPSYKWRLNPEGSIWDKNSWQRFD